MHTGNPLPCERCGREVEPDLLWTLNVNLPADGLVQRRVCVACAAEVRRFLLAQPGSSYAGAPEADEPEEEDRSPASRVGWFLIRSLVYGGIAAGVFALVTWLTS